MLLDFVDDGSSVVVDCDAPSSELFDGTSTPVGDSATVAEAEDAVTVAVADVSTTLLRDLVFIFNRAAMMGGAMADAETPMLSCTTSRDVDNRNGTATMTIIATIDVIVDCRRHRPVLRWWIILTRASCY